MNVAERPKWNFATVAKVAAVATAVGGVTLHLMGYVADQTYLSRMGVNPDMFPRGTDWLVFNGYFAYFDRLVYMLNAGLLRYWYAVAFVVLVPPTYFTLERLAPKLSREQPKALRWFLARCPRLCSYIGSLLKAGLVALTVFYFVMAASLVMLIPAAGGQAAGKDLAANSLKRFETGCDTSKACSDITADGVRIGRGYIVAASEGRVAYFDPELQQTVTRESHGLLITTPPGPGFSKREGP